MSYCVKTSKRPARTLCRAVPGDGAISMREGKRILRAGTDAERVAMCQRCQVELSGIVMLEAFRADLDGAL